MERWIRTRFLPGLPLGSDGRRITAGAEHIALSKSAAKDGTVLLKNENNTLPLRRGTRVALFGKGTIDYVKGGGGSGDVTVPYVRNLYEGLTQVIDPAAIFPGTVDFYQDYVAKQYADGYLPGMVKEPELPEELLHAASVFADTAIISISRFSGEGWDRKADFDPIPQHKGAERKVIELSNEIFEDGDFYFSHAERAMIEEVSALFPHTVVVLNVGGMVETGWLAENDKVGAVLLPWQGGMEGGLATAELLFGLGNPAGKLADTFARDLKDYPCAENFYDSDDYVEYPEDIYVGYRYFETIPGAAEKVVYPFGYGLSYTDFRLSDVKVCVEDDTVKVSVRVANVGKLPGREVVQVYYGAPQGKLGKPARVLGGYQKTRELLPGAEQLVSIAFPVAQMASYDDLGKVCKSAWLLEKGDYRFFVGTSVRDTVEADTVLTLAEDLVTEQLTARMVPSQLSRRMLSDGSFESLPLGEVKDPYASIFKREAHDWTEGLVPEVREEKMSPRGASPLPQLSDVAEGRMTLDAFVAQLPDEDLAHLLGGQPNQGVSNTYGYGNNRKYGIPNVSTADGPAGVRIRKECGVTCTAFPCSTMLACTWDPEITEAIGRAGGREMKENNLSVWLTPAVCIHRNPLCGRNFEYYSEDPLLAGKQAAGMVRGIQSNRIAAMPKHFALNNKETWRKGSDSRASERAIREIYIKQFEIIVKEAQPWGIMTSYNMINGCYASENADLLTGILRGEWGYDGMVSTDWYTWAEHYKEVTAGNDAKMGVGDVEGLLAAKSQGVLTREAMEAAAKNILGLILRLA